MSELNGTMNNDLRLANGESDLSVLLIDADAALCDLIQEFFSAKGIRVVTVHDGRRGLAEAFDTVYDLILLDVVLPGLDGFELLRQVSAVAMCRSSSSRPGQPTRIGSRASMRAPTITSPSRSTPMS